MTPPPPLYHALLRPAVLQILRAAGYHAAKTSVLDAVTDLAARYFSHLCHLTALYAAHNSNDLPNGLLPPFPALLPPAQPPHEASSSSPSSLPTAAGGGGPPQASSSSSSAAYPPVPTPTIVDVRLALQRAGALLPERLEAEQAYLDEEDTRGVEAFIAWAMGPVNREIARIALDGDEEARDYLDALKRKHSKNDDDSKYLGTLLGRPIEHGDVLVEGGDCPSILAWEEHRRLAGQKRRKTTTPGPPRQQQEGRLDDQQQHQRPQEQQQQQQEEEEESQNANGDHGAGIIGGEVDGDGDLEGDGGGDGEGSRPGSSGLSSLGDRSIADDMDLS